MPLRTLRPLRFNIFMDEVLVIGYGNPLRGDDGVGPVLAERIRESNSSAKVAVRVLPQLTPELAEDLSRARYAIFLDVSAELPPGEIAESQIEPADAFPSSFTHHLTPATLLFLAREWYGACPGATLLTVGGADFDYRIGLSREVEAALPALQRRAEECWSRKSG